MNANKTAPADMIETTGPIPPPDFSLERAVNDISPWDLAMFRDLISTRLSPEQVQRVVSPAGVFPRQKNVLAIHWHPEWIPLDLIEHRLDAFFPNREKSLVIPTQHNQLTTMGDYSGVEVDCYSSGFNRKVQLLLHFKADRTAKAAVLKSMLDHTFKYRSGQLFEYIESVTNPELEDRLQAAALETGANAETAALTRFYAARLARLLEDHEGETPVEMIKNKLFSDFIQVQRARHPDVMINRALLLLASVKRIVKERFSLKYFFRASEVIEEVRGLGGGVVIPHPEQFWPILLADYDVDGWEVWNPQSNQYTEFLIRALYNQNKISRPGRKPLLVFMGDDTHMSEKIKDPSRQERSKVEREVGFQPAWDDVAIRKTLSLTGAERSRIITLYQERLA
ncbi:MAG: hypothetical protein V1816_06065 [Pseudomonadota bacterium]